jgi:hypothetical protein
MVYLYIVIHRYKCKYVHIRVRTIRIYAQIENKKKRRPFSHGWYYLQRLKGWVQGLACPPSLGS